MNAFNRKRAIIPSVLMIRQRLTPVCPRTNNYLVALPYTSVSSFLLRGLDR